MVKGRKEELVILVVFAGLALSAASVSAVSIPLSLKAITQVVQAPQIPKVPYEDVTLEIQKDTESGRIGSMRFFLGKKEVAIPSAVYQDILDAALETVRITAGLTPCFKPSANDPCDKPQERVYDIYLEFGDSFGECGRPGFYIEISGDKVVARTNIKHTPTRCRVWEPVDIGGKK